MKILYHHRTLGDGAEGIHIAEMVKAFRRLGHEVLVVSPIGEATNVNSKAQKRWSRVKNLLPVLVFELGEIAYNFHGYLSIARAARQFKPNFIYDRYISYNYSAVAVGQKYNIPVVLEVNSPYSYQKQTFDETLHCRWLNRFFERKICRDVGFVIVVSTPLKKFLISIGVPDDQIVVMPNGADPAIFHPDNNGEMVREQYKLGKKIVIGFTGILRPWHGLDLLLKSFEEVSHSYEYVHLLIVGDGPIRQDLEKNITDRGLTKKVTITGRRPHDRIREFVAAMDIAVSPRTTFYASPMKILEYMAMGKAIVAPDMENIRDIITPEENGILFKPEESNDLTRCLGALVTRIDLRSKLGRNAREEIERKRTWLHNAESVIHFVEKRLKG